MSAFDRRGAYSTKALAFAAFAAFAITSRAIANIPWSSDFEAPDYAPGDVLTNKTVNSVTWYASSNTVVVVSNKSFSATNSAYVPSTESLTNSMAEQSSITNVWLDIETIPAVMEYSANVDVDFTASSLFYFTTEGYPVVQWGTSVTNWMVLSNNIVGGSAKQVATGTWNRITVYRNYTTKKWALFVGGELIRNDIPLVNQSQGGHSRIAVKNETWLDDVEIMTQIYTNGYYTNLTGDIDSDGMSDAWEIHYFDGIAQDGDGDYDNDGRSNVQEFDDDTDPTIAQQYPQTIPYREDFNDATPGTLTAGQWWHGMTNSGTAQILSTAVEGGQGLSISNGTLTLVVSNGATNVWVQMYAKPVFYDDSNGSSYPTDPNSNQVAAFYIRTGGTFVAFSGGGWTALTAGSLTTVPSNTWLGIATHLDYEFDCWDLYASTSGIYGDVMQKVNADPLEFNTNAVPSHFTNVQVVAEEEAFLDVLAVSLGYETNNPAHTNLLTVDRIAGISQGINIPPYLYDTNDTLLAHKVGNDMKRGLEQGDSLTVNNDSGVNVYSLEVDGSDLAWNVSLAGSINPSNVVISLGTSMTLNRGAGSDVVVFYPYTNFPAFTNTFIYGTNAISVGWTHLGSPYPGVRSINGSGSLGMGFTGAITGDRIYTDTEILIYNGSEWRHLTRAATNEFLLGDTLWYYHRGTGYWWTATP